MKMIKENNLLMVVLRSELNDKLSIEKWANWKLPRIAKIKETIQSPQKSATTHIWHVKELLICSALWETTLSRGVVDLWFNGSISLYFFFMHEHGLIHFNASLLPKKKLQKK